jgi:competence protein ComEA
MNPFLQDPVAKPLASRPVGSWRFPFSAHQQRLRLGRQAGALAIAAGVGAGLGVTTPAYAIDVNTASPSQLQAVKGVGPRTAQIIVQERTRAGHFESLEDLSDRVRGIGIKKLQAMQAGGLKVGGAGSNNALLISAETGIPHKKSKALTNAVATPLIFPEP